MADQGAAEFAFESKQWVELLKKLRKKWGDVTNRQEFGGIISANVFRDIMDHFDKEEGPSGPWDEWSNSYRKYLERAGRSGRKILQTGSTNLRKKINPAGKSWRPSADGIVFFNNAETSKGFAYAKHHDEGRSSYRGNPRPFMWLSNVGMSGIINSTEKWLSEDFK